MIYEFISIKHRYVLVSDYRYTYRGVPCLYSKCVDSSLVCSTCSCRDLFIDNRPPFLNDIKILIK